MTPTEERRRFSRISFHSATHVQQGAINSPAELVDISLKGVLVDLPEAHTIDPQQPVEVCVALTDDAEIRMTCRLLRAVDRQLALICESIDLDSISHLRRLLELNTGDPAACERELLELIRVSAT